MAVVVKDRICKQCGKTFPGGPRAWYCPECRSERKKQQAAIRRQRPGPNRPLGSIDHCVVCGKEYVVKGGMQKYCEDCAKSAVAEKDRAAGIAYYHENKDAINPARYEKLRVKEKVCIVCGKTFDPHGLPAEMCSDECRRIRRRLQQYDAEKKRQKNKNGASNEFDRDLFTTLQECADIVGVSYQTMRKKVASGEVDGALRLGRYWIVPKSSCEILRKIKMPDGFAPLKEYAKAAGMSENYVKQKARVGKIPGCIKSNGAYVVPLEVIDKARKESSTEGYITLREIAEREGVSIPVVKSWIYKGRISNVVNIQNKLYVPESYVGTINNIPSGYITTRQFADREEVSYSTVLKWIYDGKLPSVIKVGYRYYIPEGSEKQIEKKPRSNTEPPSGYITIKQMADRNGKPINTIRNLIRNGRLSGAIKICGRIYIPDSAVFPDRKKPGLNAEPPPGYITMTEYAKRRGISISAVSHSISRGRITGTIKIGNQRFIPEDQEEVNKK